MKPAASERAAEISLEPVACLLCGNALPGDPVAKGLDYEYGTSAIEFSFVACRQCGHVYLNPRPTIESARAIYPQNYYAFAGAHRTGALSVLGRIKDIVVSRRIRAMVGALPPGGRVLEAGCGDGSLLISIRAVRPDLKLAGLDLQFSADTRRLLREHDIEAIEAALEEARFDCLFDMVIMNQFIEHLWDARACMASINAGLKMGGVVSISTPNLDGYDRRLFKDRAWGGYHFPRHLNLFTAESLGRFVEAFGFQAIRTANLAAPLIWVASLHNYLMTKRYAAHRLFTDSNLIVLSIATLLDMAAARLGAATSNQQLIAKKVKDPARSDGRLRATN